MGYRRAEGVLAQLVDGRAMLIPPSGQEVIVLNATGTAVWDALVAAEPAAPDTDALAAALHAAHPDVDLDAVKVDVARFLDEIRTAGLVAVE